MISQEISMVTCSQLAISDTNEHVHHTP